MFLVQAALALALFATVMGVGVGEAVKYAQARLPYTIAQNVVNAASFVSNAVGSYCLQPGAPNPCNPTLSQLSGYIPAGASGTYKLPDGSSITLGNYGPGNTYGMRIGLGSVLASNNNYGKIVMNRIPGSFAGKGKNSIHVSQPLPAIAGLNGKYVALNPSASLQTIHGGLQFAGAISGQTPSQFWGCAGGNMGCYHQWQSNQLCLAPFTAATVRGGRINGTWTYANGSTNNGGNSYGYVLVPCNAGARGGW